MANDNLNAELYGQIGTGRASKNYQATVTYKGRLKNTIEFVAAKSIDIQRKDEVYNCADIILQLNHPFIVKFHHWYQTQHHFWLIIEYCPGGTLLELLEQDVRLPEPIIRIFGGDLLSALLYLHQNGVIFRDLHPRNIMLDECGNLKLNDFTHAERLDKPFDLGVPDPEYIEYMAPELFTEQGVASYSSDLWALGCLLYRMAAGSTPFASQSQDDMVSKIHNYQPPSLTGYSSDFNDLLQKLLHKDCFERIRWDKLLTHPFWRDSLTKRLDKTFENFNQSSLPPEPRLESNRQYLSMEKRMSTIALPSSNAFDSRLVELAKGQSIESLILKSELLKPPALVFNSNIEEISMPPFENSLEDIPITANQLRDVDPQELQNAISKTLATFKSNLRPKKKFPFISFLIHHSQVEKIATTLANSNFFKELLILAKESKNASLASGYLLLYASIVKNAREIAPVNLSEETLAPLFSFIEQTQKVARKALLSLGEIAFYIASAPVPLAFPKQTGQILINSLKSDDQPMRHYAIRAISNLLTRPKYKEVFNLDAVESAVIDFDYNENPLMLDSYATCLVMIYTKIETNYKEKIQKVIQQLLTTTSSTARTMGIMLATCTHMLPTFQSDLEQIINVSIGELRSKALLTMCIIYENNLPGFANVAQRFYSVFDKIERDDFTTAIAKWTALISNKIVSEIATTKNYELCQIILQAMPIKRCRKEIWTKSFETKFRTILKTVNYDDPSCEYLLSIVETSLYNNICDVMIVTDLEKAFNSKRPESRYTALKLVADAVSQPQTKQLISFIISSILPQLTQLLKGEAMIADLAFRIFSSVASKESSIIPKIAEKERLPLIFSRVADNASALSLAYIIVNSNQVMIDTLIETGLIDGIVLSMSKVGNEVIVDLLYSLILPIARLSSGDENSPLLQGLLQHIKPLAGLAKKCAELIPARVNKAGVCLSLLFHIFTTDPDEDILYKDCFDSLGETISQCCDKESFADTLETVIKMVEWVADKNKNTKIAMQNSAPFMKGLKYAAENSVAKTQSYYQRILQILAV
ncbi:AGC family protein kinase [Tritrichomonas foetus]|uniref:AGC family protein kinase n=1 Tax=Tritrichomonas foetus TaxID=1144522 RepID=A0A1J4K4R5_9EUKA|nr:AGC family protein kinase [Tritrichomonas foetus]|eukprot:OHT06441.1 AGC family protein kinase [Tritrichomonas foetus]